MRLERFNKAHKIINAPINVQVTEEFFDPDKYAKEKVLPVAVDFNQSYLNNIFT